MDIAVGWNGDTYHINQFLFFPFEFTFLPGANTKMVMAGIGLIILIVQLARQGQSLINKDIFNLAIMAGVVSLIGFFSVIWNDTHDYTYATYIVSMLVWLSGAYVVIQAIKNFMDIFLWNCYVII